MLLRLLTTPKASVSFGASPTNTRNAVAKLLMGARFAPHAIAEALASLFVAGRAARIPFDQEKSRSGLSLRVYL